MNNGLKIIQLMDEIQASEGWRITSKMRTFSLSQYTFSANTDHLIELLTAFEENTDLAIEVMNRDKRENFDAFLGEITRLLHNFLAAAKTLIDHTRKFFQDEYKGGDFEEEYNEKIKTLFTDSPVSKFIQDLRNYSLHRTLPVAGASLSWNRETGMSHTINLVTKSLRDWDKWTKKAMEYLDQQGEKLSLLKLVNEYSEIVNEFQEWFTEKQLEIHKESLAELEKLQDQMAALSKEFE